MKVRLAYDINHTVMSCILLAWGSFVRFQILQAFAGVTCTYDISYFICKEVTRTHVKMFSYGAVDIMEDMLQV